MSFRTAKPGRCAVDADAQETAYDLALRMGIIGLLKHAPADLSTNPRHFKGFGETE